MRNFETKFYNAVIDVFDVESVMFSSILGGSLTKTKIITWRTKTFYTSKEVIMK